MLTALKFRSLRNIFCSLFLLFCVISHAQKTGYINRPATSVTGRGVLDPNNDGYTSSTTAGFSGSDVSGSEIAFKSIPTFNREPFGDLRRGPDHLYSDFVPDNGDNGVYTAFLSNNLLFRFRLGSIMPGSKGYSILLDTDGKFGATGSNADPNYQAATTGTNGNPGFEIEIVLETNFRIAIYNVDGGSTPTLVKEYTNWEDMSQVSIAATSDNGDPDFLYDFYIPFSELMAAPFNLTTSTQLRMSATTVMSPQAAIGGPKSDIYGLNDDGYTNTNAQYEAYINAQQGFLLSNLQTNGISSAMCTAAPTLNSPISTGTVDISGTWTKSSLSTAATTATIKIYINGVYSNNSTTVTSTGNSAPWSVTGVAVTAGQVITAKAVASGESECESSNSVTVSSCNSTNRPTKPVLTCTDFNKGVTGNNLTTGWTITVENLTRGTMETTTGNPGQFTTSGTSPNITWNYAGGCSGGPNMTSGSYKVTYTNASGCVSEPTYFCVLGNGGTALAGTALTPTITTPSNGELTTATKSIMGSAESNSTVSLYIGGSVEQTTIANVSGSFTFSNLSLFSGQQIYITNILTQGTVSASKCLSSTSTINVKCYTSVPLISADNNNQITVGAPITGTSSEPSGTTINVYNSASTATPVATTTIQSDGTWTTAPYNALDGTSYYATAQNGTCGVSANSGTVAAASATALSRCGSITGPVSSSALSISGTLSSAVSNTTVILYLDGVSIGSISTNTTSWGPITVNSTVNNTLYSNGVLTIGVQESGKQEVLCSNSVIISCSSSPASFTVSPTNRSLSPGQTTTYTVDNAVAGNFYGISESTTGTALGGAWATSNGNLVISTSAYSTIGTYNINVKATSLSGVTLCSTASSSAVTMDVDLVLPVQLLEFKGKRETAAVLLNWVTESEVNFSHYEIERSSNGASFYKIGEKRATRATERTSYSYRDMQPLQGVSYYRLRMVDIDGKYTFSNVIALNSNGTSITLNAIRPNPFYNSIAVSLSLEQKQLVKLRLVDAGGRKVRAQTLNGSIGSNEVNFSDLANLPSGIYMLVVSTQEGEIKQKLVKVK